MISGGSRSVDRRRARLAWASPALALTLALALATGLAACGDGDSTDDLRPQIFTDDDIGTEVMVTAGERFEIHLESNVTTGFRWLESEMTTPGLVELVAVTYVEPDTDLVGAGGVEEFVYDVVGSGAGVLRLEYVRSFEEPMIPDRVAEFIVRVDGAPWPPQDGSAPSPSTVTATAPSGESSD